MNIYNTRPSMFQKTYDFIKKNVHLMLLYCIIFVKLCIFETSKNYIKIRDDDICRDQSKK